MEHTPTIYPAWACAMEVRGNDRTGVLTVRTFGSVLGGHALLATLRFAQPFAQPPYGVLFLPLRSAPHCPMVLAPVQEIMTGVITERDVAICTGAMALDPNTTYEWVYQVLV